MIGVEPYPRVKLGVAFRLSNIEASAGFLGYLDSQGSSAVARGDACGRGKGGRRHAIMDWAASSTGRATDS
jgi:hypothetical protein